MLYLYDINSGIFEQYLCTWRPGLGLGLQIDKTKTLSMTWLVDTCRYQDQDQDLNPQDQDRDLNAQDQDQYLNLQDQDLSSQDQDQGTCWQDQDQDLKIGSRDGLETKTYLEI